MDDSAGDWVEVDVSVGNAEGARIDEVAERLRGRGMLVSRVLGSIGIVSGVVPLTAIDDLRSVPGVSAVERSRHIEIPAPDSDVQ